MGISKIGALFASNIDPLVRQRAAERRESNRERSDDTKSTTSSDAVVIASSVSLLSALMTKPDSAETASRAELVRNIRRQVISGEYRRESRDIAQAVVNELSG